MRLFFPAGQYTLIVDGYGIDLSAVGAGSFTAVGKGFIDDGYVVVDGGRAQDIDLVSGNVAYGGKANADKALLKVKASTGP